MPSFFDAHNHLQDAWLVPSRARVWGDLARVPLRCAVVNGTEEKNWLEVARLGVGCRAAAEHDPLHFTLIASYGLHPWHVGNRTPQWRERLRSHLEADPHAGVGEIGLDRWMLDRARPDDSRLAGLRRAPMAEQLEAFTWQFALATSLNRPATVHCLDAWGTLAGALRETPAPTRGFLLHAYGGSAALAREFAAHGAYFSFNGSFLGERQNAKREAFKLLPADRILVETDAPAMPLPANRRTHELPDTADGNTVNHPANIGAAYSGLAEIRGVSVDALAAQVERNFAALFL